MQFSIFPNRIVLSLAVLLAFVVPVNAHADTAKQQQPVEIEADQQLEWLRDKFMYRGTGNVSIKQGDTIIRGDYAEAFYDGDKGPSALTTITVKGHVTITNLDRVVSGDQADYDTRTQIVTVTGSDVRLKTPDLTATAKDRMEYHAAEQKAVAKGDAVIEQPQQKLQAQTVTAFFDGESNAMTRAEAHGNVIITKKNTDGTDIAQSNEAHYDATTDIVNLKGNVRLTRGADHMQGDHATINMKTGYSTLKNAGASAGKKRVRAVFTTGK